MRRAVYDSEDYQEGMNAFLENVNLISLVINPCERRSKNGTQWTRMTADEAAEIIQHNDMWHLAALPQRVRRKPYPPRLPQS